MSTIEKAKRIAQQELEKEIQSESFKIQRTNSEAEYLKEISNAMQKFLISEFKGKDGFDFSVCGDIGILYYNSKEVGVFSAYTQNNLNWRYTQPYQSWVVVAFGKKGFETPGESFTYQMFHKSKDTQSQINSFSNNIANYLKYLFKEKESFTIKKMLKSIFLPFSRSC